MASEFGIGIPYSECVGGKPTGDEEAIDHGRAGVQARCSRARLDGTSSVEEAGGIAPRWAQDQCRARRSGGKAGWIGDDCSDIAVDMQRVAPDKRTVMPDLPALIDETMGQPLAAGLPPENENAAAEKARARSELDTGLAPQPRAIEQDRLGRQIFEPGALCDAQLLRDHRRCAGRTINLLGGRGGDVRGGVLPQLNVDRKPVTGDEAPGGRQQYREWDVIGLGRGKQHPQRITLVEMRE